MNVPITWRNRPALAIPYRVGVHGISPGLGLAPDDIFGRLTNPSGSGKLAIVRSIYLSVLPNSAQLDRAYIQRRAATTLGTETPVTPAPLDSASSASSLAGGYYTASPTKGILQMEIAEQTVWREGANGPINAPLLLTWPNGEGPVLRPGEDLCILLSDPDNMGTVAFAVEYLEFAE